MAAKDLYEKDFYKVLGVDKKSTPEEIKKKYRSLARDLHPDKTQGDAALEEKFKAVSEAYDLLSDSKKRAEYDEARSLFEKGGFRAPTGGGFQGGDFGDIFGGGNHKISLRIYLVVAVVVVHVKDKIFKLKQQLHFANQSLEQRLIFA